MEKTIKAKKVCAGWYEITVNGEAWNLREMEFVSGKGWVGYSKSDHHGVTEMFATKKELIESLTKEAAE